MKVSVVMPVYNAECTVLQALESLRAQTLPPHEIVVVNDGSTDGTHALLQRRPDLVLLDRPHRGIAPALNDGLAAATGDAVARMDADDLCHPERFEKQAALLAARPEIGVTGCRVGFGGDRKKQAGYAAYVDWINGLVEPDEITLNRFIESPLVHPSVMFRRELSERFGAYRDGPFPEDYECWLRWMEAGVRFAKVDEELLGWHDPPDRLSRTNVRYSIDAFYRTKAEYLMRWLEQNNPRHPEIFVLGAGRVLRRRAAMLAKRGVRITHYIDVKPRQLNCGTPVLMEDEIPAPDDCFILSMVGRRGARDGIRFRLRRRGFVEGIHCLFAA